MIKAPIVTRQAQSNCLDKSQDFITVKDDFEHQASDRIGTEISGIRIAFDNIRCRISPRLSNPGEIWNTLLIRGAAVKCLRFSDPRIHSSFSVVVASVSTGEVRLKVELILP